MWNLCTWDCNDRELITKAAVYVYILIATSCWLLCSLGKPLIAKK